jgi:menaquinone-dependent protoporphyrinogen oxidase
MEKVLIAYATWAGATHQVADEIAKTLRDKGFAVEVDSADKVKSIEDYQAVILGTSIHASQPVKGFNHFLSHFHKELGDRPVAFFVVCANMMEDNEKNRTETLGWLKKTTDKFPEVKPVSIGLFGGAVTTEGDDYRQVNFIVRKMIESMKENIEKEYKKSDFRDWEQIRAWVVEISKLIKK